MVFNSTNVQHSIDRPICPAPAELDPCKTDRGFSVSYMVYGRRVLRARRARLKDGYAAVIIAIFYLSIFHRYHLLHSESVIESGCYPPVLARILVIWINDRQDVEAWTRTPQLLSVGESIMR